MRYSSTISPTGGFRPAISSAAPNELDYLEEPDIFHDVFGHVPMLTDPVFADYMQAYGKGGLRALSLGQPCQSREALLVHGRVRALGNA